MHEVIAAGGQRRRRHGTQGLLKAGLAPPIDAIRKGIIMRWARPYEAEFPRAGRETQSERTPKNVDTSEDRRTKVLSLLSEGLPTLPTYVFELNGLLSAVPVNLKRVGAVIRTDPSLSAQVIRLCNSALFNLREKVMSIEHAVIILGTERLRTLVLTCSLVEYAGSRLPPEEVQSFWQHSFVTAILAEKIARWSKYGKPEQAYLGGLLHDVGILPLLTLLAKSEESGSAPRRESWGETPESEKEIFGVDHCTVGRWIGVSWNFPAPIVDVFEYHHDPSQSLQDALLVGFVAAADQYCQARGIMMGGEPPQFADSPKAFDEMLRRYLPHLSEEKSQELASLLEKDFLKMTEILEMNSSSLQGLIGKPH
jgi:HD-like signal output (HDOD) protein